MGEVCTYRQATLVIVPTAGTMKTSLRNAPKPFHLITPMEHADLLVRNHGQFCFPNWRNGCGEPVQPPLDAVEWQDLVLDAIRTAFGSPERRRTPRSRSSLLLARSDYPIGSKTETERSVEDHRRREITGVTPEKTKTYPLGFFPSRAESAAWLAIISDIIKQRFSLQDSQ